MGKLIELFSARSTKTVKLQKFRNANRNSPHCFSLNKFLHVLIATERRLPSCVLAQGKKKKRKLKNAPTLSSGQKEIHCA